MSAPRFIAPRRPRPTDFSAVTWAARLHLCAVDEEPEVRRRHIAALLAFTPTVVRVDTRMRIRFEHGATALWLTQVLAHKDVALADRLTVHLDEVRPGTGRLDYAVYLRELAKLDPDLPLMLEHLSTPEDYRLAADHLREVARRAAVRLA